MISLPIEKRENGAEFSTSESNGSPWSVTEEGGLLQKDGEEELKGLMSLAE